MMLDGATADDMVESLKDEDFRDDLHKRLFEILRHRILAREPVDQISMAGALHEEGVLQRLPGGAAYLHEVVAAVPLVANAPHYAHLLKEASVRRRLWKAGTAIIQASENAGLDADDAVARAVSLVEGVRFVGPRPVVDGRVLVERLRHRWANPEANAGWSTGLVDLDRMIKALQPGRLYCIAGRPGMGKSILLADIARATAIHQKVPTQFFELEMSDEELGFRLLAAESGMALDTVEKGSFTDQEWQRVEAAAERINEAPIEMNDTSELSMSQMEAHVHNRRRTHGVRVVLLDYLQLVEPDRSIQQRQEQVSAMSRRLKLLARREDVAVVFAAQLNRGPEARQDKRPQLSDLRESGSLEQDADVVILVHRPEAYDQTDRPGEADLIVAKNRSGQTGIVTVTSVLWQTRFANYA